MKKNIGRVAIAIFGFLIIAILSVVTTTYYESNKFTLEQIHKVRETKDFQSFLKVQTTMFREVSVYQTSEYKLSVIHTINQISEEAYENNILIAIVPLKEVEYATNKGDDSDQTKIILKSDEKVFFNTETSDTYKDFPLSYGYGEKQIGFIYVASKITEDLSFEVSYYDFTGALKVNGGSHISFIDYNPASQYEDYQLAYKSDEVSTLIGLEKKIIKETIVYSSIFLVILIIVFVVRDVIKSRK